MGFGMFSWGIDFMYAAHRMKPESSSPEDPGAGFFMFRGRRASYLVFTAALPPQLIMESTFSPVNWSRFKDCT